MGLYSCHFRGVIAPRETGGNMWRTGWLRKARTDPIEWEDLLMIRHKLAIIVDSFLIGRSWFSSVAGVLDQEKVVGRAEAQRAVAAMERQPLDPLDTQVTQTGV